MLAMLLTAYFYLGMKWIMNPFAGAWDAVRGLLSI